MKSYEKRMDILKNANNATSLKINIKLLKRIVDNYNSNSYYNLSLYNLNKLRKNKVLLVVI